MSKRVHPSKMKIYALQTLEEVIRSPRYILQGLDKYRIHEPKNVVEVVLLGKK